jgi:hypothetical protein
MDSILPAQKLQDEINAVKRHLQALCKQQLKLENEHTSAIESRPRRVNCPQVHTSFMSHRFQYLADRTLLY